MTLLPSCSPMPTPFLIFLEDFIFSFFSIVPKCSPFPTMLSQQLESSPLRQWPLHASVFPASKNGATNPTVPHIYLYLLDCCGGWLEHPTSWKSAHFLFNFSCPFSLLMFLSNMGLCTFIFITFTLWSISLRAYTNQYFNGCLKTIQIFAKEPTNIPIKKPPT